MSRNSLQKSPEINRLQHRCFPMNSAKFLTPSLSVTRCVSHNTDLASNTNFSKTARVNSVFTRTIFKEYSISFLIISRLKDFALVVLELLMFKVCVIIGISEIVFFNFCGTERVNDNFFTEHFTWSWSLCLK